MNRKNSKPGPQKKWKQPILDIEETQWEHTTSQGGQLFPKGRPLSKPNQTKSKSNKHNASQTPPKPCHQNEATENYIRINALDWSVINY